MVTPCTEYVDCEEFEEPISIGYEMTFGFRIDADFNVVVSISENGDAHEGGTFLDALENMISYMIKERSETRKYIQRGKVNFKTMDEAKNEIKNISSIIKCARDFLDFQKSNST